MSKFGGIWNEHKSKIELFWNKYVTENDLTLIPGDISWGKNFDQAEPDLQFIHSLPGIKIFIQGNHDWWLKSFESIKNSLPDDIILINWNNPLIYNRILIGGEKGSLVPEDKYFIESKHRKTFERNKEKVQKALIKLAELKQSSQLKVIKTIFLLHYAPNTFYGAINIYADYIADSKIVDYCVYGHIHSPEEWSHSLQGNYKGVDFILGSCDYLNFVPKLILSV